MPRVTASTPRSELPSELDDERARLWPTPVEEAIRLLAVVDHDEQSGPRRIEPRESRIRVPHPRLIAVLREGLDKNARSEKVGDARADQLTREPALIEAHVVVVHQQR